MSAVIERTEGHTLADLMARLGNVPLSRVLTIPAPGTAVEQDVLDFHDHKDRLCAAYEIEAQVAESHRAPGLIRRRQAECARGAYRGRLYQSGAGSNPAPD